MTQDKNVPQPFTPDTEGEREGAVPQPREKNRIERLARGEVSATSQKMKITLRFMKQRRRRRWRREYDWIEDDLDRLVSSRDALPEDVQDYSLPIVLIGTDVEQLYPSLDADEVAEIIYQAIMLSEVKWDNIDYLEAVRFISLSWSLDECNRSPLRKLLPVRRGKLASGLE
jgi:hypothetical protein